MNPLGPLLVPSTSGPNGPALRCHRCYLQPSQRRRRHSILGRGLQLYDLPLAESEGLVPPISPRRDRRGEPFCSREPVHCYSPSPTNHYYHFQAEALWMSASDRAPLKPPFDPSARRTPRWDDIPALNFSSHGGNTISPANVGRAIEVRQARFHRLRSDTRLLHRHCRLPLAMDPQRAILSLSRR